MARSKKEDLFIAAVEYVAVHGTDDQVERAHQIVDQVILDSRNNSGIDQK
jgi:hypothetical protein